MKDRQKFDMALADVLRSIREIEKISHDDNELLDRLHSLDGFLGSFFTEYMTDSDPRSTDYIQRMQEIHRMLLQKRYDLSSEGFHNLQIDEEVRWGWPYCTRDASVVGDFLGTYAFVIKRLCLKAGASILEVGFGFGGLTYLLAKMGYRVDAIEVNGEQCEIVRRKTEGIYLRPNIIQCDCLTYVQTTKRKYDAVVFFGSFHHLMEHKAILNRIINGVLHSDGKILLANEPISQMQSNILPYPWGIRFDGESLRAICCWGWLELGFTQEYLKNLFDCFNFSLEFFDAVPGMPRTGMMLASPREKISSGDMPKFSSIITVDKSLYTSMTVTLHNIRVQNTGYGSWLVEPGKTCLGWKIIDISGNTIIEGRIEMPVQEILPGEFLCIPSFTLPQGESGNSLVLRMVWELWQWFGDEKTIPLNTE